MTMKTLASVGLIVLFAIAVPVASGVTINFDDQPLGPLSSGAYPQVEFSTPDPDGILIYYQAVPQASNSLNPGGFVNDLTLSFTNPVNDLQFLTFHDNHSDMADIDVYVNGAYAGTVDLVGATGPDTAELQDLSAFEQVTSIEIYGFRPDDGVGYDEFSFTVVPEPAALCLFAMSLASAYGYRRRNLAGPRGVKA